MEKTGGWKFVGVIVGRRLDGTPAPHPPTHKTIQHDSLTLAFSFVMLATPRTVRCWWDKEGWKGVGGEGQVLERQSGARHWDVWKSWVRELDD